MPGIWKMKVAAGASTSRSVNLGQGLEPSGQVHKPFAAATILPVPPAENEKSQVPDAASLQQQADALENKTLSLFEEFFSIQLLNEALKCVEEPIMSPAYHPEAVKEAISFALGKSPHFFEAVQKFLDSTLQQGFYRY